MSDLIAISFDSKEKAQQALERAGQMQKQHLLDLAPPTPSSSRATTAARYDCSSR